MNCYFVYIMTNSGHTTLYVGVTNNLERRVSEHREGKAGSFTTKYKISKLVWYIETSDVTSAIQEEKRIKGGSRQKKIQLIESLNPKWEELLPT
ncbi:GIY-YIG nuclease family protein [Candidatus Uhrbacteria bacterium]|nr:MAG: GIY-YIG nuclease family protein [Candidatus Uhrbacteria bacterium]